jgi:cbb3-type cytochrome oxidase subunit 3
MADNQLYGQYYQQPSETQPTVSYLSNPNYNPTIVVHHHNGVPLNTILMAITGTLVILLFIFLAGIAFYIYRKRCRYRLKKAEKASESGYTGSQMNFSRSILDSERDFDSTFRHSRATCDTCSTRARTTRPPLSYSPIPQRQSFLSRKSQYLASELPQATIEEPQISHPRMSVRLMKQQSQTTLAESASVDNKSKFDWDRCDFEMQEEESMWLPSRPQALKSHHSLKRGCSHSRACSESATSPPPKSILLPNMAKSRSRVTWTNSALSLEAQSDYFECQRTAESSFATALPSPSTPKNTAGSGTNSPLILASPSLVHNATRHSYSAKRGTRDWEDHAETIEHLDLESSLRCPKSPSASISSALSGATAFSDPFGGSKVDLNSDFVVLSRPSPTQSERTLPILQVVETRHELGLMSAPMVSSPLKMSNESTPIERSFREPLANQQVLYRRSENFDRLQKSQVQRRRSATVGVPEVYQPLDTPLRTLRIDRRGAVVAANNPVSPTNTDYDSSR